MSVSLGPFASQVSRGFCLARDGALLRCQMDGCRCCVDRPPAERWQERVSRNINALGEDDPAVRGLKEALRSRRDHQGARGGVGGINQVGQRGGGVGGWIQTSEFSPPAVPADFARELAELRACVQALQLEGGRSSSGGCQAERGGSSKECQVARRTVPRPRDGRQLCAIQVCLQFIQCDGNPH